MGLTDLIPLEQGRVVIGLRGARYYARVWISDLKKYKEQSLRTSDREEAISRGRKFLWSIEEKRRQGLPLASKSSAIIIDAYVKMREAENRRGATSDGMLRQIKRIARFWKEYLGRRSIAEVTDRDLKGYVEWRRNYYLRTPPTSPNAKVHPTDKSIQFEMMIGKAVLRWAVDKGLRPNTPINFSFTAKNKRVRPAFDERDYKKLIETIRAAGAKFPTGSGRKNRIRRELLWLYVEFLANSGIRVGEANNLKVRDIEKFKDDKERTNIRLRVKGKTGERDVIFRVVGYANIAASLIVHRLQEDPNSYFFKMPNGSKVITLIDQFKVALKRAKIERDSQGRPYTLYSLRHYYAVQALKRGVPIFTIAKNMGTSVAIIQSYYGSHATTRDMATVLGD